MPLNVILMVSSYSVLLLVCKLLKGHKPLVFTVAVCARLLCTFSVVQSRLRNYFEKCEHQVSVVCRMQLASFLNG